MENTQQQNNLKQFDNNVRQFTFRLDFYWKALSLYAIVLSVAIIIEEFFSNVKYSNLIYQPLIFLMILFVLLTSLSLLYQFYRRKKLMIDDTGITISYRNHSKTIHWNHVKKIAFVNDRINKNKSIRLVKIKIENFRSLRINPNSYDHESELISTIEDIKNKFHL